MKNIFIKINELKISNYKRGDDSFTLNIHIDVDGIRNFLKKEYKLSKPELMTQDLINFIRDHVKSKNKPVLSKDLIENIIIIRYAEDLEELETKLSNFFRKFSDLVRNFKSRGYSENYLMVYKTLDGFSQRF